MKILCWRRFFLISLDHTGLEIRPNLKKRLLKNKLMSMASIKYDNGWKGYIEPHEELSWKRNSVGKRNLSSG